MNTKTIVSISWNGSRIQLVKRSYPGAFVKFDILQDRRVVKSGFLTLRSAAWELLMILRSKIINDEL